MVVGTIHTLAGLRIATRLKPDEVDLLELRLDALADHLDAVERALPSLRLPVLLTVRHPDEGGVGRLASHARRALFDRFFSYAAMVDVELRSVRAMGAVIARAKDRSVIVVVSDHHFKAMPSLARLQKRQHRAFAAGADVFKLAAVTDDLRDLARMLKFVAVPLAGRRAVMGMGQFGQVSRLVLARAGSVLNYGFLDRPNAAGQWEARELRKLLDRIVGQKARG